MGISQHYEPSHSPSAPRETQAHLIFRHSFLPLASYSSSFKALSPSYIYLSIVLLRLSLDFATPSVLAVSILAQHNNVSFSVFSVHAPTTLITPSKLHLQHWCCFLSCLRSPHLLRFVPIEFQELFLGGASQTPWGDLLISHLYSLHQNHKEARGHLIFIWQLILC